MINLNRFKYKKGQVQDPSLPDVIPETPPKRQGMDQGPSENSTGSGVKRKYALSSDEEGKEDVYQLQKKTRITHFLKNKQAKEERRVIDQFISVDSGSDDEVIEVPDSKAETPGRGAEYFGALSAMFPTASEELVRRVSSMSYSIQGAIAILSQWKHEDMKNRTKHMGLASLDSQDSNASSTYDSPVLVSKKRNALRLDSAEKTVRSPSKNYDKKSSKRLGLSSSESESDNEETKSKRPFPRLNCVISNDNYHGQEGDETNDDKETKDVEKVVNGSNTLKSTANGKSSGGIETFYSSNSKSWKQSSKKKLKMKEQPKSFSYECLTEDNAVDENFDGESSGDDGDYFHFGIHKRKKILEFFQNTTMEELLTIHGCSKKKAETILALKPYKSWNDLVAKFDGTKPLNTQILSSCSDLLKERIILQSLLRECRSISDDLAHEIERLRLRDHMTEGSTVMEAPSTIASHLKLKPYQLVGLNWIALLHRNKVNGILADEMGLGKTVQTIAFLAHLLEQDQNTGPHVVVVPSSTLDNWCREFSLWCPSMEVVLYHGSQDERRAIRVAFLRRNQMANVIITTYNCAISSSEDRMFFRKIDLGYAVFDEGHMLKNMSSQRYMNLMKIRASRRLLLTGTPLQNNLLELMSLLRFVMPHMFEQTTDTLVRIFSSSSSENKSKFAKERIRDAKEIMQPFVLRRLKDEVLKQLPDKRNEVIRCEMTEEQDELYKITRERYRQKLHKNSALEMKNAFVELRKVANHPMLRRHRYTADKLVTMAKLLKKVPEYHDSREALIVEDMKVMTDFELHRFCRTTPAIRKFSLDNSEVLNSGKFRQLDILLPEFKNKGSRVVMFSQFTMIMDIMESYLEKRNHKFLRLDGSTPVSTRLDLIDRYTNDASIFVFLLSTKAGGLGINLTAADVVILHDIDMNPYNDKQAEDRCHRLGQTKIVRIIRLVSHGTLEEGMLQMAHNKLQLEQEMTGGSNGDDSSDIASLLEKTLAG